MAVPNNYRRRIPATTADVESDIASALAPQSATLSYSAGVLTSVIKGGVTKTLTYDPTGKLSQVSSPTTTTTLSYDSAGNLARTTVTNA